jgi:hypothetical protein
LNPRKLLAHSFNVKLKQDSIRGYQPIKGRLEKTLRATTKTRSQRPPTMVKNRKRNRIIGKGSSGGSRGRDTTTTPTTTATTVATTNAAAATAADTGTTTTIDTTTTIVVPIPTTIVITETNVVHAPSSATIAKAERGVYHGGDHQLHPHLVIVTPNGIHHVVQKALTTTRAEEEDVTANEKEVEEDRPKEAEATEEEGTKYNYSSY